MPVDYFYYFCSATELFPDIVRGSRIRTYDQKFP
ncbi:hypothetical protein MVUOKPPV_CDS0140 [Klebsiella phage phi1_175008]|uniref:Uncharacterized protein n=1 Tax=Klebsiella phage phi1_175008 TaxID=3127744 RepID=A0ACD5FRT6_9CAUD